MDTPNLQYEFRWFGLDISTAREKMAREGGDPQYAESREVHILSRRGSRINCRMDAKATEVTELASVDDGLELWKLRLKQPFPLDRSSLEDELLPLLGVNMSLRQDDYDMEEVVDKVIPNSPDLVAVHVHQRQTVYEIDGCQAGHSELLVNGAYILSIAITSENAKDLLALRSRLGFDGLENVSYLGAFKRVTGMVPLLRIPSLP